ncbi:DUF5677 domain-containing protein [Cupriavidus sp. PET2-C1]
MNENLEPEDDFASKGFLGSIMPHVERAIRLEHDVDFAWSDRLNEFLMLLVSKPISADTVVKLTANALLVRSIQTYQASVLLCQRGMLGEARTLERSVTESAIAMAALLRIDGFVEELVADHRQHRKALANAFVEQLPKTENVGEALRLSRAVKEEAKAEEVQGIVQKSIKWADVAQRADVVDLYNCFYRGASGDAAHVSLGAIDRHIISKDGSIPDELRLHPHTEGMTQQLRGLATVMINLVAYYAGLVDIEERKALFDDIVAEWHRLPMAE